MFIKNMRLKRMLGRDKMPDKETGFLYEGRILYQSEYCNYDKRRTK